MTEKTKSFSIRLNTRDKEELTKHITRKSLESILRQIEDGEIEITDKGVKILENKGVNTASEGVNTTIEPTSENQISETFENSGVNTDKGLYIKVYADSEPQEKAEKLYQICEEDELIEVCKEIAAYCDVEITNLKLGGFEEVCDFRHIDQQKALDKCVQMLWQG